MRVTCTKPDAAIRQLDVAIRLLFEDDDPVAVRTLAGAAYGILADLAERQEQGSSWRRKIISDSGLEDKQAFKILNAASNYLKHADRDADATLSFSQEENDNIIFIASLECGNIGHPLSYSMQAFQLWYLALHGDNIGNDTQPVRDSKALFPDLPTKTRPEQLALGRKFVEEHEDSFEKRLSAQPIGPEREAAQAGDFKR